jgi:hypothetical protein
MVVDTIADLYNFLTGKTLKIVLVCFGFSTCAFADPTQVLPAPSYELLPLKVEKSVGVRSATCHVVIRVAGDGSKGRGTIIEPGNRVLTCQHLFRESTKGVTVTLSTGEVIPARVIKTSKDNDLALLSIPQVVTDAAPVSPEPDYRNLRLFNTPHVRCVGWSVIPQDRKVNNVVVVNTEVNSGASGGGLFNATGIYGVIWGSRDGQTFCTAGKVVREFVGADKADRLVVVSLPNDICYPCALVSKELDRLKQDGYNVSKISPSEYHGEGIIKSYPTLLFYRGDTVIYRHSGVQTADQIKERLNAPASP